MELTREDSFSKNSELISAVHWLATNCHEADRNIGEKAHSMLIDLLKEINTESGKPDIWSGAPEWATTAKVLYSDIDQENNSRVKFSIQYTRELPKSPEREIAEKLEDDICMLLGYHATDFTREKTRVLIESAIKEALALKA